VKDHKALGQLGTSHHANHLNQRIIAVIRVGDGRGFIVEADYRRLVLTAAHCLPHFPPCHGASYLEERTYCDLLGLLDTSSPNVCAECLSVDPIADLAVLGSPDNQALSSEAEAYETPTGQRSELQVAGIPERSDDGFLQTGMAADSRWSVGAMRRPNIWGTVDRTHYRRYPQRHVRFSDSR
jgi:hypothetical protein